MKIKVQYYLLILFLSISTFLIVSQTSKASLYGRGSYGNCTYQDDCTITASTLGTVNLNITPSSSGVYTIDTDTVTVTTNSSNGYNLQLNVNSSTSNALVSGSNNLNASSASDSSPAVLPNNTWGYRIDDFSGFGAGPTTAQSNQPSSTLSFAGVPLSIAPTTIKTTATSAPSGDSTSVWYGVHATNTQPSGLYTIDVTYTAVAL